MDCKTVHKEIILFIDEELDWGKKAEFRSHLDNCDSCSALYENIKSSFKLIEEEKINEPDPFFYTRLEQRIKNREEQQSVIPAFTARILQIRNVYVALLFVAAVFSGLLIAKLSVENIDTYNTHNVESLAQEMEIGLQDNNFNLLAEAE